MTDWLPHGLLVLALVSGGLLAGVYFAFSCAVCPALRRVDDTAYVRAFRAVNAVIQNGWFLSVLFLAPLSAIAVAVWPPAAGARIPAIAAAVLAASAFLSTVAVNVPLNNALDAAPIDDPTAAHAVRSAFEERWNRWNLVRAVTTAAALAVLAAVAALPL